MKIFKAFTLVEVLVTLAIIGLVAVIATPMLVKDYQRKVAVAQLQEAYYIASQGFENVMIEEKARNFTDTKFFKKCFLNKSLATSCQEEFNKHFNTQSVKYVPPAYLKKSLFTLNCDKSNGKYSECSQSDTTMNEYGEANTIVLNNGSIFYMRVQPEIDGSESNLYLTIDTNGDAEPNTYGRDLFIFLVDAETGKIFPGSEPRPNAQDIIDAGWKMEY